LGIVKIGQHLLRLLGYEVVPYPPTDWIRTRDTLRRVLDKLSINCVFDVGANAGDYGNLLRAIGYKGWIVSFEPVQATFSKLAQRAAARPPWKVYQLALGSTNGQAEINLGQSDYLTSFLTPTEPTKNLPQNKAIGRETVEVRRLDSIFEDCMAGIDAKRLYLKMDTQGFDLEVLRGSDGVLDQFVGAQTELSFVPLYEGMPGHLEALKEFESRGFSVVDFVPVTRVAGGLLMMEMDSILARAVEPK
jgi:FkbM family methyltransferase